ncbi:MAG: carbohydrate kinase [Gemmataceae bacterium]|nr:carbohydrate kinase [Gemmataceae bacterium]MBJ7497241.1 carbohydrate kinase [Gemmataceae bacterium]
MQPIVGFGEILWDMLPLGKQAGGAPFNFTFHSYQLGWPAVMVSRVGKDELGQDLVEKCKELGLNPEFLQEDLIHPTGTVEVELDSQGQAEYEIKEDVAWDHLEWNDGLKNLAGNCAAVCFGTLCQRHSVTRNTLKNFLERCPKKTIKVFDINLRQNFYNREILEESLYKATWAKVNEQELETLTDLLGLKGDDLKESLEILRRRYNLELAALTLGENGCLVNTKNERIYLQGHKIEVVDTIGAGDSFTAGLLVGLLKKKPLRRAITIANDLAAQVASKTGGTPLIDFNQNHFSS